MNIQPGVCWCFKSEFRPQVPDINKLSEEQIRDHLLIFGGTPKHLIEDQDFLKQCIPLLKADVDIVKKFM
jgi:medium-chain acyl-[acyl-carrier-protein] hydrolase